MGVSRTYAKKATLKLRAMEVCAMGFFAENKWSIVITLVGTGISILGAVLEKPAAMMLGALLIAIGVVIAMPKHAGIATVAATGWLFAAYEFYSARQVPHVEKPVEHIAQVPAKITPPPRLTTLSGLLTSAGQAALRDALQRSGLAKTDNIQFSIVSAQDVNQLDRANQLKQLFSQAGLGERNVTTHGQVWFGAAFHGVMVRAWVACQNPEDMAVSVEKAVGAEDALRSVVPARFTVMPNADHAGLIQILVGQP